jgi:nitrous oxidase accessory protein NosD
LALAFVFSATGGFCADQLTVMGDLDVDGALTVDGIDVGQTLTGIVRRVDTVVELSALSGTSLNGGVLVAGYHGTGDGGGGIFYWDAGSTATDDGGLVIAPNVGGIGRWHRSHGAAVDVRWFGTVGDGVQDDSSAVSAALNSGVAEVIVPAGQYKVGPLAVPDTVRHIHGAGELLQAADAQNILNVVGVDNLQIEGLTFIGVGGNLSESRNTGIDVSANSSDIRIFNNRFGGLRHHAVHVKGSTDLQIAGNRVIGVTQGIRATFCSRLRIINNYIADPQYTGFSIAIGLDSTDTPPFGVCTDVVISDNVIENYHNSQAIMVHAGERVAIANNIMRNVLIGVSMNQFQLGDTLRDITVVGNVYHGTNVPLSPPGQGNYGLFAGGDTTFTTEHIVIADNVIYNANAIVLDAGQGGIGLGYVDDILVEGNVIRSCVGSGIVLNNDKTRVLIRGNSITDVVAAPDTTRAGIYVRAGPATGRIEGNVIDGVSWGMRFDVATPGLLIGPNDISNFTFKYINPINVTFQSSFDGDVSVSGDLQVSGVKNFVQFHPEDPGKKIAYIALEGPEASTYVRGAAKLVDGKAIVSLPDHFRLVTIEEGITVQLAPEGEWLRLFVEQKGVDRIVVREADGRSGSFSYFVQGVRKGFEDHPVVQPAATEPANP